MPRTIEISDELSNRLETRVTRSEFDSVEGYVTFVLSEVVKQRPELEDSVSGRESEVDESRARENLESLGYLE